MYKHYLPRAKSFICASCRKQLLGRGCREFASTSSPPEIYDIVTVGGGPVGLALLAALKSSPATKHLKTALVESQDLTKAGQWKLPPDRYSNRASSLTPASISFLEDIGAWTHVDATRVQPYHELQVYDASNDASLQFDWTAEARKYNAPPRSVATMTENANLTKALLDRISELDGDSSLFSSTSVSSVEHGHDEPTGLNLSSWPILSLGASSPAALAPSRIAARLLIGADGFNSPVRKFAGISSQGWDYHRHGVVATLTTESTELSPSQSVDSFFSDASSTQTHTTAYQRFLPALGGPIALLPLPNNHASLVWSTTPQNAAYLKALPPSSFVAMVNAAFRLGQADLKYLFTLAIDSERDAHTEELHWRLPQTHAPLSASQMPPAVTTVQDNTVASFPLRFRQSSSYTSSRVALAGDAAHTIHPLAGQGLNLGLGDARALVQMIEYAVLHGQDLGDSLTLERYGTERWGAGLKVGGVVDGLGKLYGLGGGSDGMIGELIGWARGVGMKALNSRWGDGARGLIMRQAEG